MVVRTEVRMASVLLVCLLVPLRVAAQCTSLGVAVEFVAPSDSGHVLVTDDSEVAKNTALCHVKCLSQLVNETTGIIELQCSQFKQYLDCRYGCVLQSQGQSDCGTTCESRCPSLCDDFPSCFRSQVYECGIDCDEDECSDGCGLYDMITAQNEDVKAPLSGPDLVQMNGTHAYEVAIPEELSMFDTPSLVFRIEDQSSPGDYVYQWMVDVQFDTLASLKAPVVDLSAYSCRTVSVSYAFATTMGLSEYSTATVIDVPGVATQCTPLGVSVEFATPNDSEHVLVTDDIEVSKNTALCHVKCLSQLVNETTDIIELECSRFKQYLDCRYGCVLQSQGQSDCGTTCESRCLSLCDGFPSCFRSQVYQCGIDCNEDDCSGGCGLYNMITGQSEDIEAPLSGPDLIQMNGTHAYEVAIPDELSMFDTPSLVFRIEDQSSPGDYVYQWMVDVQFEAFHLASLKAPVVDLAAYSCRTVSVSYAFATTMGLSEYSTATVIDVPGNQTTALAENDTTPPECTVPQLEGSEVHYTRVPDERAGFFTHFVWNVAWNLTSCQEKVTGFTITLIPYNTRVKYCGETLEQTVDSNTSSVSLRSTVGTVLDLPCNYMLKVQVNPRDQGSVYTKRTGVSIFEIVVPELEIIGCPAEYNRNLNKFEVNFQWKANFSPAGLGFIEQFQITVFEMERGRSTQLATYSPEFELVNFDYDPLHNHERRLNPYGGKDRYYRFGIEVVWNHPYSSRSGHCDTVDTPAPPPDPIENIYNTSADVLDVLIGSRSQAVRVSVSFSWDEPELNYNVTPIQLYQAHLALEPLNPGSRGDATAVFFSTSGSGFITRSFGIGLDVVNFTAYLQMQSYQFQNLPSNWSDPQPINILLPASVITFVNTENENSDIEYSEGVPNVVFSARVTWDPVEVTPPVTFKHYDVWVNKVKAGFGATGNFTIFRSTLAEREVTRKFPLLGESLDIYIQVRSVVALSSATEESGWSRSGSSNTINIASLPVPAGLSANFTNPRLIQQPSQDTFSLSVEISVHWESPESAGDITGYELYIGYEELRPYDMFSSASAVEGRNAPVTLRVDKETTQTSHNFSDTVNNSDNVIFVQVRALSEVDYTKIPQWSEPVCFNLTHLPSEGQLSAKVNATLPYNSSVHCLYLMMRSFNEFVPSDWSKPLILHLDSQCILPREQGDENGILFYYQRKGEEAVRVLEFSCNNTHNIETKTISDRLQAMENKLNAVSESLTERLRVLEQKLDLLLNMFSPHDSDTFNSTFSSTTIITRHIIIHADYP